MDSSISPSSSTTVPSPSSSPAGGTATAGPSSSDSTPAGGAAISELTPPRRRLVKAASRHFDEHQPRVMGKRDSGGVGTGPPGFAFDRSATSPSATSPGVGGGQGNTSLGAPLASSSNSGTFRERERGGMRSSMKRGDLQGDYPLSSPHGHSGGAGPTKMGRTPFSPNQGPVDARPLGRRPEISLRRHEAPNAQKHAEDMRIQQAKRAALLRAQTMGAPGNYKSFDSQFGNYLVPVIPNQYFNKNPLTTPVSPALQPQVSQGR
ncbi:hypothetical protein R1sor_004605 [Riccia sorocarpa]|uniref:Uncharacterized protein n=1 Tax=Riccia sorocarpa TaxID=122646 RepID=A0ABD3HL53_9MARC